MQAECIGQSNAQSCCVLGEHYLKNELGGGW